VLESLDREYRRDEDWCNTDKAAAIEDKVAYIQQLINKHQEQKEAFLKVSKANWLIDFALYIVVNYNLGHCRLRNLWSVIWLEMTEPWFCVMPVLSVLFAF